LKGTKRGPGAWGYNSATLSVVVGRNTDDLALEKITVAKSKRSENRML
jgi:hypothetical protein